MRVEKEVRICEDEKCGHHNEDLSHTECVKCGLSTEGVPTVIVYDDEEPSSASQKENVREEVKSRRTTTLQRIKLVSKKDGFVIEVPILGGVIGREGDVEPHYFDTKSDFVSRRHARIYLQGSGYYIVDEGSHNGTTLNKQPLYKGNGQEIIIGSSIVFADLEFQVHEL